MHAMDVQAYSAWAISYAESEKLMKLTSGSNVIKLTKLKWLLDYARSGNSCQEQTL